MIQRREGVATLCRVGLFCLCALGCGEDHVLIEILVAFVFILAVAIPWPDRKAR